MAIIPRMGAAVQVLLGRIANEVGELTNIIVRRRKFTAESLAATFVLGFLQNAEASDEELAQVAVQLGAEVTPQAVEQRHTPKMAAFLKELFQRGSKMVIGSEKLLAPIIERFTSVTLRDSSTISLPGSMKEEFPGCGGSHGGGAAALKLQTDWDLRTGALDIDVESGRSADGTTPRQFAKRVPGSLLIQDLGYFSLAVFASIAGEKAYFLSRLQYGTKVLLDDGQALDLMPWLKRQSGAVIDQWVFVGQEDRLPCRIIAWRLPQEQADRRRQKLRKDTLSKKGHEPSEERLAWCDWTILITNVPGEMLTPAEAIILYRARWQIELLFKRWKSQDRVAELTGSSDVRQMIRVWARLLAALAHHWLVVTTAWGNPTLSWGKVSKAIRSFVGRLIAALGDPSELERALLELRKVVEKTCQRNKRSKPGTVELLNNAELLEFGLT